MGIISCPGCPTLTGPEKLLQRIKSLTLFRPDAIHFAFCVKALCPFREKYKKAIEEAYPGLKVVVGTHQENLSPEEFREKAGRLFCQERKTMADIILGTD